VRENDAREDDAFRIVFYFFFICPSLIRFSIKFRGIRVQVDISGSGLGGNRERTLPLTVSLLLAGMSGIKVNTFSHGLLCNHWNL
jgi:hypothetical protein